MGQLKALGGSVENDCMLANDVAFTDRLNRNFSLRFLSCFQTPGQRFGRPAGRIFFHFVMRFDNLGFKIAAELFGSFAREPEEHIDSDAEVRCKYDRQRLCGLFNYFALLFRVTGRPNHQRLAMPQGSVTDFSDGVGLAKIDSDVATLHSRFDRIAKVASCDDVDLRIVLRKIANGLAHATSRANEQHANARRLHSEETFTFPFFLWKGEATLNAPLKFGLLITVQGLSPAFPLAEQRIEVRGLFGYFKFLERPAQPCLICFAHST